MAKISLSLKASPTFKAPVNIPVPGGKPIPVEFTFKSRTKTAFKEFIDGLKDREDIDVLLDIASGWELAEPFDKENVELLIDQHIGSALEIIQCYIGELTGARGKN